MRRRLASGLILVALAAWLAPGCTLTPDSTTTDSGLPGAAPGKVPGSGGHKGCGKGPGNGTGGGQFGCGSGGGTTDDPEASSSVTPTPPAS